MLLSRRLCVLLGAACVGCVGPTPIPEVVVVRNAINGANYWGSTEYFVRRNGAESLCDKLIETYGGIANACVVIEPVVNLLISATRFTDTLLRGTTTMARDFSCGPNSLNTDCADVLARAEDQSRASEFSLEAQTTLAALMDWEIMDIVDGVPVAGALLRKVVHRDTLGRLKHVFDGPEVLVGMMMLGLVCYFDPLQSIGLRMDLSYMPWCFFGQFVWKCCKLRFICFWRGESFRNNLACFALKRLMHMSLASFGMLACLCMWIMQRQSTTDVDVAAAKDALFGAYAGQDGPCRYDSGGVFAEGGRTGMGGTGDDSDDEDQGTPPPQPPPPVALSTVRISVQNSSRGRRGRAGQIERSENRTATPSRRRRVDGVRRDAP